MPVNLLETEPLLTALSCDYLPGSWFLLFSFFLFFSLSCSLSLPPPSTRFLSFLFFIYFLFLKCTTIESLLFFLATIAYYYVLMVEGVAVKVVLLLLLLPLLFLFSSRSSLLSKKQPTPFPAKRENKQWSQAPVPSSYQSEARRMLTHVPPSLLQTLPSSHTPAPLSSPPPPHDPLPASLTSPPPFSTSTPHSLSPSRVRKKGESIPKSCTEHSAVRS